MQQVKNVECRLFLPQSMFLVWLESLDFTPLLKRDDEKISGDECRTYINGYHHLQIVSAVAEFDLAHQ